MTEFVWKERFNIGVQEIDSQHQSLLRILNEFIEETRRLKNIEHPSDEDFIPLYALIRDLQNYTDTHFLDEEELMQSVNYPQFEEHRKIHRGLRGRVERMEQNIDTMDKIELNKMVLVLRDWYLEHILVEDKKIGTYILSRLSTPGVPSAD